MQTKGHSIQEYKEYKNKQSKNPRKRPYNIDNNNVQPGEPDTSGITTTQKKQRQVLSVSSAFSRNSQKVADDLITSFVVETMSPMDIVEHQAFKNLICGVNELTNSVTVMTRKTLRSRVDTKYTAMLQHLTDTLGQTKYVCTIADIWSSSKRSFLGITAHWINASFQRESAALACHRFKGKHSYDRIAEMIHDIHCEFKLDTNKIVKVTTDNASNMVKAFSMFSEDSQNNKTIDLDKNDNDDSDDDFVTQEIQGITEGIAGDSGSVSEIFLPVHQRCASHTLSLIAIVDIKAALTKSVSGNSGGSYTRSHHSTFGKCSAIRNLTSRSPKAAETYFAITGKASSLPYVTRWNSTFDCLNDLIAVKQFLGSVCDALDLPKFKDTNLEFLAEYIECVKPIAEALDRLQGE
ncbi:uncharacterized protein [Temnothorax nylanderi]|uniref:uncharacterized protein n=1 Tax=Temnothorax nylanderi TaxID=102681 RepID=UPI003A8B5007